MTHSNALTAPLSPQVAIADFQPFPGEPTFLNRVSRPTGRHAALSLLPVVVVLAALAWLCVLHPPHQPIIGRICADMRQLLGLAPAQAGLCSVPSSTWFSPARDIYSIIPAIILAATPLVIRRQWLTYTCLLTSMIDRGAMILLDNGSTLAAQVKKANRSIKRVGGLAPIVVLVVSVAVVEMMAQQSQHGIFHVLAPEPANVEMWARESYEQWWAASGVSFIGHSLYFALAAWGVYVITQQNLVGFCIIRGLWRSRRTIRFGADPLNVDGYFGWSVVREALVVTYVELAMHGLALVCVALMMPPGSLFGPMAIASFQWMISLPVHLGFPFLFVGRKIHKYKTDELARLEASARALDSTLPEHERISIQNILADRMAMIRSIPILPFKSVRDTAIFVMSVVADSAAVTALIIALFRLA